MMYWTKERPKHEGYYWFLKYRASEMLEVWDIGYNELFVQSFGTDLVLPLSDGKYDGGLWFGPIESPPAPNVVAKQDVLHSSERP